MVQFVFCNYVLMSVMLLTLDIFAFCHAHSESKPVDSSTWPQLDMVEHVPGEPLSPIDYQNAELLINIPPPNTLFSKDPIELAGLYEGDIMLTGNKLPAHQHLSEDAQNSTDESLKNAINKESQKWVGGVIPYFIASQFNPVERSTIARAFLEYQRQTCIIFKPRTNELDYVHIMKGKGCSSHVGRTGGAQPVILGDGCVYPGIAMHELMHAVGFWHEQSRWDRDDHVTVSYQNILANMEFNFQKYSWSTIQNLGVQYDTSSILHYGPYAFAKDKRYPTITPKIPNDKMGQRTTFSSNDVMKINRLYYCSGEVPAGGTEPQVEPTTTSKPPKPITESSGETRCLDTHKYCPDWSARGECQKNAAWMLVNCKKSCDSCNSPCTDLNQFCGIWFQRGECDKNPDYMKTYCPKSCGTCAREAGLIADDSNECGDKHIHCNAWAARGECTLNPNYMLKKCRKACQVCVPDSDSTLSKNMTFDTNLKLQKYQIQKFGRNRKKFLSRHGRKEL